MTSALPDTLSTVPTGVAREAILDSVDRLRPSTSGGRRQTAGISLSGLRPHRTLSWEVRSQKSGSILNACARPSSVPAKTNRRSSVGLSFAYPTAGGRLQTAAELPDWLGSEPDTS
jgi:hypothetical protein